MLHKVLYQNRTSPALLKLQLSVQPPEFEAVFLENDDSPEVQARKLAEAEFFLAGHVDEALLARMPTVRMIQTGGVGYENIDVDAVERRGIPVAITPEGTVVGVSEHTILLMLAIYKHLTEAHNALKLGEWIHNRLRPVALMLQEKRVGIVGMGRIGREVAKRLQGWDVELVYFDVRQLPPDEEARYNATYLPLQELLRTSDIVTLHVFLSDDSKHLIGEKEMRSMKPTGVLINTSRGGIVDEAALYRVMKEGHLYGAGIDAWQIEPTPPENPLLTLDNIVFTPHMATANRDAVVKKSEAAYANFQRILRGEAPINTVRSYKTVLEEAKVGVR